MSVGAIIEDLNPWWRQAEVRPAEQFPARRDLERTLLGGILEGRSRRAVVVYGPRQTGKTVILQQLAHDLLTQGLAAPRVVYFDFSDDRLPSEGISPRGVVDALPQRGSDEAPRILLLDEIEYARNWDRFLKQAVDRTSDVYIVTSSAAAHLRHGTRESGLGRWDERRLEPLSFREFLRLHSRDRDTPETLLEKSPQLLERYMATGGFPEHIHSESSRHSRQRLREDIAERAILRDLLRSGIDVARAKDLFVYLVQQSGSVFETQKIARLLQADKRSIREWRHHLEDSCLVISLPRRGDSPVAQMRGRQTPKMYAADSSLVFAFSTNAAPADDPDLQGRLVETAVYRHLRELTETRLMYYRHRNNHEVDFVVSTQDKEVLIEVTASRSPTKKKLRRLHDVSARLRVPNCVLIYGGLASRVEDQARLLPFHEFLLNPGSVLRG